MQKLTFVLGVVSYTRGRRKGTEGEERYRMMRVGRESEYTCPLEPKEVPGNGLCGGRMVAVPERLAKTFEVDMLGQRIHCVSQ